jgi:hypothetical protein
MTKGLKKYVINWMCGRELYDAVDDKVYHTPKSF